jgi:hypothetical protein
MPESSFVLLGTEPPKGTVKITLRYDLPDSSDTALAAEIAAHALAILDSQELSAAIAIGYGPDAQVRPLAAAFQDALRDQEPGLIDFLRVERARYWSYTCTDEHCCPPVGVPFDSAIPSGDDTQVLANRAAVAAGIAPVTGAAAESMRRATRRAQAYASRRIDNLSTQSNLAAARKAIADRDLAAVRDFIATYRDGRHATDYQVAWLTVALKSLRIRDDAWSRMDPDHRDCHLRMWTDVVRRAQPGYVAAPASLLAFVAWQTGEGALANIALDRALADDPDYSLAKLLRKVLSAGAPPSMATLPMTPEEVAACYDDVYADIEEDSDYADGEDEEDSEPRDDAPDNPDPAGATG